MSSPILSIVIPTYNEEGNIGEVVRRLEASLGDVDHETIVVDDDSRDETRTEARNAGASVRIIHRKAPRGLSSAVLDGFRAARGDYVCVMDGDLQHPPEAVSKLLEQAVWSEADLVVGSRFVPGGEVEGFPRRRRFVSWGARTLTRLALPVIRDHDLRDPNSGFFLVERARVDPDAIEPRGYKILVDVLHNCPIEEVREVPITFHGRYAGESKLTVSTEVAFLQQLALLAVHSPSNQRVGKFGLVGLTGVVVNLTLLAVLTEIAGLFYIASAAIAIEASILSNFALNDTWTFRDRRQGRWWERLARFNLVSLGAMAVNLVVLTTLVEGLGVHYLLAEAAAIGVSFLANYTGNLSWTYMTGPPDDRAPLPWMP